MEKDYKEGLRVSECCGGERHGDSELCPYCYEHADFVDLWRYNMNKLTPNFFYAPTQTEMAIWLRQVCESY